MTGMVVDVVRRSESVVYWSTSGSCWLASCSLPRRDARKLLTAVCASVGAAAVNGSKAALLFDVRFDYQKCAKLKRLRNRLGHDDQNKQNRGKRRLVQSDLIA